MLGNNRECQAKQGAGQQAKDTDPGECQPLPCARRQVDPKEQDSNGQQHGDLGDVGNKDQSDLAQEIGRLRHRQALQSLERAIVSFHGNGDRKVLEGRVEHSGRDHPCEEVLGERHITETHALFSEHRSEDDEEDHRQGEVEDGGLAVSEELPQFDPDTFSTEVQGAVHGSPPGKSSMSAR